MLIVTISRHVKLVRLNENKILILSFLSPFFVRFQFYFYIIIYFILYDALLLPF